MWRFWWNTVVMLGVLALFVLSAFTAGYSVEKAEQRKARCINSSCDTACKPGQKFQRHQGDCKK